jgi:hypothetical protein
MTPETRARIGKLADFAERQRLERVAERRADFLAGAEAMRSLCAIGPLTLGSLLHAEPAA